MTTNVEEVLVPKVDIEETIRAKDVEIEDVAVVSKFKAKERVQLEAVVLVHAEMVAHFQLTRDYEVALELLVSQEAEDDEELQVQDGGVLLAYRIMDLVARSVATAFLLGAGILDQFSLCLPTNPLSNRPGQLTSVGVTQM